MQASLTVKLYPEFQGDEMALSDVEAIIGAIKQAAHDYCLKARIEATIVMSRSKRPSASRSTPRFCRTSEETMIDRTRSGLEYVMVQDESDDNPEVELHFYKNNGEYRKIRCHFHRWVPPNSDQERSDSFYVYDFDDEHIKQIYLHKVVRIIRDGHFFTMK